MRILFIIILVALFVGPFRRPFLRYASFTIPATLGALAGLGIGIYVATKAGVVAPMSFLLPLAIALVMGFSLGEAGKNWCDQTFGKDKKR